MSVNLRGAYLCTWYAFPLLKAADNARVLFMSSNVAFLGTPGLPHYVAAKAGLIGLTRALARELGPHHINVNCVVPSLVQTESTELLFPGGEGPIMAAQAIRRRSVPEDVVGLVVFLAADESEFITGQTISVDGGLVTR
jgi:3-oxoacyl-[acyl-carrier protein] reductase